LEQQQTTFSFVAWLIGFLDPRLGRPALMTQLLELHLKLTHLTC